jgi:hypothetical protein
LSSDFVIRAVTRSYLASSGRAEEELVASNVFDAFPESPASQAAGSTGYFAGSVERVLKTRRPHRMSALRYDVADPCAPGAFVERRWGLVTTPIQDGDDVIGVMVRVQDVTAVDETLAQVLRTTRERLAGAGEHPAPRDRADPVSTLLAVVESYRELSTEVSDLRRALSSRPVIEQAKGIIMAGRRCSADEAFALLRRLSMETNVRVADVAAAVVYQLRSP